MKQRLPVPRGRAAAASAQEARRALLEEAREAAVSIARRKRRPITADDVVGWYKDKRKQNLTSMLGNAMGGLFRGEEWKATGKIRLSNREVSHSNKLCVWKLKGRK